VSWGAPAGGGVVGGGVLDVFSVLADEGRAQLGEDGAELGDEGGADEVLYGLLGGGFGEDVDVKLEG
jgi:secreted protein with Ig-like and vWFA domain